jgi:hypothetical protein
VETEKTWADNKAVGEGVMPSLRRHNQVFYGHMAPPMPTTFLHRRLEGLCVDGAYGCLQPSMSYADGLPGPMAVLLGCLACGLRR